MSSWWFDPSESWCFGSWCSGLGSGSACSGLRSGASRSGLWSDLSLPGLSFASSCCPGFLSGAVFSGLPPSFGFPGSSAFGLPFWAGDSFPVRCGLLASPGLAGGASVRAPPRATGSGEPSGRRAPPASGPRWAPPEPVATAAAAGGAEPSPDPRLADEGDPPPDAGAGSERPRPGSVPGRLGCPTSPPSPGRCGPLLDESAGRCGEEPPPPVESPVRGVDPPSPVRGAEPPSAGRLDPPSPVRCGGVEPPSEGRCGPGPERSGVRLGPPPSAGLGPPLGRRPEGPLSGTRFGTSGARDPGVPVQPVPLGRGDGLPPLAGALVGLPPPPCCGIPPPAGLWFGVEPPPSFERMCCGGADCGEGASARGGAYPLADVESLLLE